MEHISPELISLDSVSHSYPTEAGRLEVLRDVSFSLAPGNSLSIVGPSGCGKTTILMILAGLLRASTGSCRFKGRNHESVGSSIALMQQQYGLFPWKTVEQNIRLAYQLRKRSVNHQSLISLLQDLGIEDKLKSFPGQLSGGQQQRVALARSMLLEPELMLLDEPFGAVDTLTRERLQDLLRRHWINRGFAMVTITHSMSEAVMLGQRILVMQSGPGMISRVIDNPAMRNEGYRESAEYLSVMSDLRAELGAGR